MVSMGIYPQLHNWFSIKALRQSNGERIIFTTKTLELLDSQRRKNEPQPLPETTYKHWFKMDNKTQAKNKGGRGREMRGRK